jgi:hypothetical protein
MAETRRTGPASGAGPDDETEAQAGTADRGESGLTTVGYLRLVATDRASAVGLVAAALGAVAVRLTSPAGPVEGVPPTVGASLLLGGLLVFALGFSRAQRTLSTREDW